MLHLKLKNGSIKDQLSAFLEINSARIFDIGAFTFSINDMKDEMPPSVSNRTFADVWTKKEMEDPWMRTIFRRFNGGLMEDLDEKTIEPYDPELTIANFINTPAINAYGTPVPQPQEVMNDRRKQSFSTPINYLNWHMDSTEMEKLFNQYVNRDADGFFYANGFKINGMVLNPADPDWYHHILLELEKCRTQMMDKKQLEKDDGSLQAYISPDGLSSFTLHRERNRLWGMNICISGGLKIWIVIPERERQKVVQLTRKIFEGHLDTNCSAGLQCPDPVSHMRYNISPAALRTAGIAFTIFAQKPGTGVVTTGDVYHEGLNIGSCFNLCNYYECPRQLVEYLTKYDDCPKKTDDMADYELDGALRKCLEQSQKDAKLRYKEKNREKINEYNRRYYADNQEKLARDRKEKKKKEDSEGQGCSYKYNLD